MIKNNLPINIIIFTVLILGLGFLVFLPTPSTPQENTDSKVVIGATELSVLIADTPELTTRGLSGRESLEEHQGMLFIFDAPEVRGFWMKEMNFPIDIIWIDENLKIVDITKEAQPESYPEIFNPSVPAQYVLEVNAGFSAEKGIKIGDAVIFSI